MVQPREETELHTRETEVDVRAGRFSVRLKGQSTWLNLLIIGAVVVALVVLGVMEVW